MSKPLYRVSNWREYDRALVERGDIKLWIAEAVAEVYGEGEGRWQRARTWEKPSGRGQPAIAGEALPRPASAASRC